MQPHDDDGSEHAHRHEGRTEEHSFDELAKGLASSTITRRQALRGIGVALFGGVLASLPAVAWAKPKPGKCNRARGCASPEDRCCRGVCTNIVFDRNNCGACGNVCPEGYICQGSCIPPA